MEWGRIVEAINHTDLSKSKPGQFMFWVAGIALAIAFVIRPGLALWAAVFAPNIHIPEIDLAAMWSPVLGILGMGGLSTLSNFVNKREERKTKELEIKKCATCPDALCQDCPVRKTQ